MPLPEPPVNLPPAHQPIWDQAITALTEAGTAERVDVNSLMSYVAAVHAHQVATDLITRTSVLVIRDGTSIPNPALQVQKDAANTIRNFARAFGLTRQKLPDQPIRGQDPTLGHLGRWCEEHGRWECVHQRSKGRGQCHGTEKYGTDSCRMHGGQGQDLAHEDAKLRRRVGGVPLDVTPSQALLGEVKYQAGVCAWLDDVLGGLTAQSAVWGVERRVVRNHGEFPGVEITESARLHLFVQWHARAHDQLVRACESALRANVEERLVRMAELDGAKVFAAMNRGLMRMDLTPVQWAHAREVMPQVLRELMSA
jgi:P27 family predicted phage terminase small subunit